MSTVAERRAPQLGLKEALFLGWVALGVTQLVVDVAAMGGEVLGMSEGGDNVVNLPVVNVQIRQSLIEELYNYSGGGGPPDDDDEWWKTVVLRAITYGGLSTAAIEDTLFVRRGTVKDWVSGNGYPKGRFARRGAASIIAALLSGL